MAVSTQVVYFQKDATGFDNATQDINLNFTPKAIIVMSVCTDVNNLWTDGYATSWGFSDGTTQCCMSTVSLDNAASGTTRQNLRNNCVFASADPTQADVYSRATVAFGTNKVTFTWVQNDMTAAYIVMKAFGGDDITNVKVNTVQIGRTTAGTQDYTGLGFNPTDGTSVLFTIGTTFLSSQGNALLEEAVFSFGCATSATKRWSMSNTNENTTASMDTDRYFVNDGCLNCLAPGAAGISYEADFNSWITDGFQLDWEAAPSDSTTMFHYMVIKGGTWDVGTDTVPLTTSSKNHSVSVSSRTLRGLLMMNGWRTDTAFHSAAAATAVFACGVSDGTNEGWISAGDMNGAANAYTTRMNSGTNQICGAMVEPVATGTATGMYYTGAFSSFGTNQFTISYTEYSGLDAQVIAWVVVADAAPQGELKYGTINESPSISVSESLARIQTRKFALSETSVSVSESLARIQYLIKTISDTPTISVSELLGGSLFYPRPISESNVTVGTETLERIQYLFREIADSSVSISESIEKIQYLFRSIEDPSNSISETLAGLLYCERSISEDLVSVSESLTRLLSSIRPITNEDPITVSEILAGQVPVIIRTINETAVSIDETLQSILTVIKSITNEPEVSIGQETLLATLFYLKTIEETSISLSETLERIQYLTKAISESSVTVGEDSIARWISISYALTEPPISISGGDIAGALFYLRSLSETSVSVSESLARLQSLIKTLSEDSVSVSETLERIQTLIETISESPISVSAEDPVRIPTFVKSISETGITIPAEALNRLFTAVKTIAEAPSISIDDTIARVQTIIKEINETPAITTSDSATSVLIYVLSLIESRIKWYYSLLTRKIPEGET